MKFDKQQVVCVTAWKWSASQAIEKLQSRISEYPVSRKMKEEYERELQTWIDNSWLLPYIDEEFDPPNRRILLKAILQTNKCKMYPVMNYCELNTYVNTFMGAVDIYTNCENGDHKVQTYPFWISGKHTYRFMLRNPCGHTRELYSRGSDIV